MTKSIYLMVRATSITFKESSLEPQTAICKMMTMSRSLKIESCNALQVINQKISL